MTWRRIVDVARLAADNARLRARVRELEDFVLVLEAKVKELAWQLVVARQQLERR